MNWFEFLGIGKGMTVVDVIAAGGYYTEVLSVAVGASGKVYAQNPAAVLQH
jgi:predicted methyltransferase|tara:strand:+ start:404 stop:556 length:153 start_codon:yes stop_codon:yes gene_type:complete